MAGCALLASGLADEEAIKLSVAGPLGGVQPGHNAAGAGEVTGRQVAPDEEVGGALGQAQVEAAKKAFERGEVQARQTEPDVQAAELNLSYAGVTAPADGFVTKKAVEDGDYIQVGQKLMALVPNDLYVTANFKETQVEHIRPGQPVKITVDSAVDRAFTGHVDSIMAGSGARFSLLPPENAVGMRNLGGSFGIALVSTIIVRRAQVHQALMVELRAAVPVVPAAGAAIQAGETRRG